MAKVVQRPQDAEAAQKAEQDGIAAQFKPRSAPLVMAARIIIPRFVSLDVVYELRV